MGNIVDDHRSIEQRLGDLERTTASERYRWVRTLVEQLDALARTLVEHFATEGDTDLYTDVSNRCPELAAELSELRVEHASILEMLDDVRRAAEKTDAEAVRTSELLEGLISSIRAHEEAEASLLRAAVS